MISLLLISIILVVLLSYTLNINNINTFLLLMGILLLIKTCIDDNIISNTFNIKQNKQNKQPSNVILSETNSESNNCGQMIKLFHYINIIQRIAQMMDHV